MPTKSMVPPAKRPRLDKSTANSLKFTTADEIRTNLRTQNQEELTKILTALRNQLTIRFGEPPISSQDERLILVQSWLESAPGAHDLFSLWEATNQRQTSLLALILSVLSSILTLSSSHYTYQALGQPIIKSLLTPTCTRKLNSYVGGSHAELILSALKLFNGISSFAGGRERKSVLEAFAWETKSLPKLLNMRRKTHDANALVKPDIRTLYILFVLSFIGPDSPAQIKTTFLEQHRDAFLAIFKGVAQDSYLVVRKIFEACWAGIWSEPKLKRTLKIGIFNEATISHIIKLYDRVSSDDDASADLAHHFLLAMCTRPGMGICFKDRGWYPREADEPSQGKIYNKILANILKTLKVNEDPRQQELALKIMSACPELVAGYWSGAALTLEPRLSSKWIANIAFFGTLISLPAPSASFLLPNTTLYQPSPPPLSNIMENILPSVNTKAHLSKGLQSTSALVQHCTALALSKCLIKYEAVICLFRSIERILEETEDGQWCKRRRDVEREARRRVPDFQVVVAFSQQKFGDFPNTAKAALLSESAQRLLWLYHRCLPSLVAEARFDVGKLLYNEEQEAPDAISKLHTIRQLHVLRLLKESDQFFWSGKFASSSHSYLYVLLKAYVNSGISVTRVVVSNLLQHILSASILFQEDRDEPQLWLMCLPTTRRAAGAESPDGAPLMDEVDSVVTFLDDCVQRCLKTPHRYIDELYAVNQVSEQDPAVQDRLDAYPSPLLMTVIEQLDAKMGSKQKPLSLSDVLALSSFVRKLVFRLSEKQQDFHFLRAIVGKVDAALHVDRLNPEFPVVSAAVRREVAMLHACLCPFKVSIPSASSRAAVAVEEFLHQVESVPIPTSKTLQIITAFELVDWVRLLDQDIGVGEVYRLTKVIARLHLPALGSMAEYLRPDHRLLWDGMSILSSHGDLQKFLTFDWVFIHTGEKEICDVAHAEILVNFLFSHKLALSDLKRAIQLFAHALVASQGRDNITGGLLTSLALVLARSAEALSPGDFILLKEIVFLQTSVVKDMCMDSSLTAITRDGLSKLIQSSLNPNMGADKTLVSKISSHWLANLKDGLDSGALTQLEHASIWIKYFPTKFLFDLLDIIASSSSTPSPSVFALIAAVLDAIQLLSSGAEIESESALRERLPQLLALRTILKNSSVLEALIAIALEASVPLCINGAQLRAGNFDDDAIVPIIRRSDIRWPHRSTPLSTQPFIQQFLAQEIWSASTVKIICGLMYRESCPQDVFVSWLNTKQASSRPTEQLSMVLQVFLDTLRTRDEEIATVDYEAWIVHFSRLVKASIKDSSRELRSTAGSAVSLMLALMPSKLSESVAVLIKEARSALSAEILSGEILLVGLNLHAQASEDARPLVNMLVSHGLEWAVRRFASEVDMSDDVSETIEQLTSLVKIGSDVKAHHVETLLGVAIQHQLTNSALLNLVTTSLSVVQLKPLVVNRHLQSIIQHPQFFRCCATPQGGRAHSRDAVIDILHVLFNLHPNNTCQATHVGPLVQVYRGTLSASDAKLLSIFQLFEVQRKTSVASLLSRWSSSPEIASATSLDALQSLDAILVLRTCLSFPTWRRLEGQSLKQPNTHDTQLYDPVFLMLLFAQMLAENPPVSAFAAVQLFRTNVVSLLIRALSSKDGQIRDIALSQITALWTFMEAADMQERPHVLHILVLLKNVLPPPSEEPPIRLPTYTTLILLHALRAIFYPSNFIYPLTARFLLQRPELDTNDIPMLYNMLYSSSDDWKKERGWIIRFLSDGMTSTDDWRVFKRRHTWELLASMFQSSKTDYALRNGVFEVLANLTCNAQATTSLVLKSALLAWIEIQLIDSRANEGIEWTKILENIMTVADPGKLESSTRGEWRAVISRCILLLLDASNTSVVFPFVASTILRLSLLPGPSVPGMPRLLDRATERLKRFETSVTIPRTGERLSIPPVPILPPHGSHRLHDHHPVDNPLQVWGASVEALWRVGMTLDEKPQTWEMLTRRLMIWRGIVGKDSVVGEWVRTEVVRSHK